MRTDVKIGVAVGLLFVIAIGGYYAIFDRGNGTDPNEAEVEVARAGGSPGAGEGAAPEPEGVVLPRFGSVTPEPATPRIERGGPPEPPTTPEPPVVPVIQEPPTVDEPPTTPEPSVTPTVDEPPTTPEPPVVPVIREPPTTPEPPVTPRIAEAPTTPGPAVGPFIEPRGPTVTPRVGPAPPGVEQTYVVKKGDAGFWAIAEKVYGDGRFWMLIAKANPEADSNKLPPGKRLRIPPKPVARPAGTGGVPAGGLIVTPSGQRQYIVRKGDAGFWGIAQTVFGDGKYWMLISKANPGVNSNSLKPGDRLEIPAKPIAAATPRVTPVPTIVPGPGQKLYVVQESDTSGFWGIAKKLYGNGLYWPAIAEANPTVKSTTLKAGRKLIIPELTDTTRRAMERRPTTRSSPPPARKDVEDLGPRPVFR